MLRLPIPCSSDVVTTGKWVDCTDNIRKSEAMHDCDDCPLVPIGKEHIGTVIAYNEDGCMSAPHFMFAYSNGMAFLMKLNTSQRVFNLKISKCYPLQGMYMDIVERAVSDDPLVSSRHDMFFKWLRSTSQFNKFVGVVNTIADTTDKEDAIQLFELLSYEGITASTFEEEVDCRYSKLAASEKDFDSKYTAVLSKMKSSAPSYSKVEKELMRRTNFQYKTPKEAWKAIAGNAPLPDCLRDIQGYGQETVSPDVYIAEHMGSYSSSVDAEWFGKILPSLYCHWEGSADMPVLENDYVQGVTCYLENFPEFDENELSFIQEDDKQEVFKRVLGVDQLSEVDPFRAWMKHPPKKYIAHRKINPDMPYTEMFVKDYNGEL